jgi:hypothetical protein
MEGDRIVRTNKAPSKEGWERDVTIAEWIAAVISLASFVFFLWKRNFSVSTSIEETAWGTFGDFLGGCVGTLIAYINVRLLVKTLKQQIESNREISENNKYVAKVYDLQQFDEQFKILFAQYRETISRYPEGLETIVPQFISFCNPGLSEYANFNERIKKATAIFKDFYVRYQSITPIHFRLLYRIFQQIDDADIPEDRKREIIKIVRCQLSPEEILLLRYNALSPAGKKMQGYINRFNLLKHLRMMDMLEMYYLRKKLEDIERNSIDTEIMNWRKEARQLFLMMSENEKKEDYDYSNKYQLSIRITNKDAKFEIRLEKKHDLQIALNATDVAMALDKFSDDDIKHFLLDFCEELFLYSNFQKYNEIGELRFKPEITTQAEAAKTVYSVEVENTEGYPLICSQKQMSAPNS